MDENTKIYVYGDSIMKATMPDEKLKYHFHVKSYMERFRDLPVTIVNQSHFGATVEKGQNVLLSDLEKGISCEYALIEYGGNDCDFDWGMVAEDPDAEHMPKTELNRFLKILGSMADQLMSKGIKPVLMTLPPLDASRYLNFITRQGLSRRQILKWLGDVNMIYRFQELYSGAICRLAAAKDLVCIDIRSYFLSQHDFGRLISADGIHPSERGYDLIFQKLFDVLKAALGSGALADLPAAI